MIFIPEADIRFSLIKTDIQFTVLAVIRFEHETLWSAFFWSWALCMLASESTILTPSLASVKLFFNVVRTFVHLTWEFVDSHLWEPARDWALKARLVGDTRESHLIMYKAYMQRFWAQDGNQNGPIFLFNLTSHYQISLCLFSLEERISLKICDRPLSWRAKWALPKWTWWPNYKLFSSWAGVYRDFLRSSKLWSSQLCLIWLFLGFSHGINVLHARSIPVLTN